MLWKISWSRQIYLYVKMKTQFIPSIIAKNQKELDQRLNKVKFSKIIQLDVMNGKFVKNKSLQFDFIIPKYYFLRKIRYEAHLMMKDPQDWIKKYYNKFDLIIIHIESNNIEKSIELIRKNKKKIGIAINPKTLLNKLKNIHIKDFDTLLIMTVYPGKYGSKLLPEMLKKVKQARKLYPSLNIEVDGGITNKTIQKAKQAGANKFVVGSYLQNANDAGKAMKKIRENIK